MYTNMLSGKSDPIFALNEMFRHDKRSNKIDLGVGVFKNDHDITPLMKAVELAEKKVIQNQNTKVYQGLNGNEEFNQAIIKLLIKKSSVRLRSAIIQTTGGSGALRLISDYIYSINPSTTVWISNPSYANHYPILNDAGLKVTHYNYINTETKMADVDAIISSLMLAKRGDIILLHGCCHNPTGADLSIKQWSILSDFMIRKGLIPFIDIAYQGLGDGLEEDAAGLNIILNQFDEVFITTSCSKNFGLYAERIGAAIIVCKHYYSVQYVRKHMTNLVLNSYAMPPNHGAKIVSLILNDYSLRKLWESELSEMRKRIKENRVLFHNSLATTRYSDDISFILKHKGMFSSFGWKDHVIDILREEHCIYIVKGGRVNFAAMSKSKIERITSCIYSSHQGFNYLKY
ncbi:aspartate/tyrosine/aromatic aminotransferase [Xenorhabdus sp. PB61.4]|uniref:amino acid aminotransferase n=1 Tax=Xenorhabdus sp. PB61.4 TaxID=2788940 RepID=UPI001E592CFE|nr:aromatic amino acid transaminase [Xenorhabdus sp. PB61.4]MCC8368359.1 aspartate/tyrosine/aromatic aminotransferase [Xenorhabdus sp. PB61.4]